MYCRIAATFDEKFEIFRKYFQLYNEKINSFFKDLDVEDKDIDKVWGFILTSEEGLKDTQMSSEILSAEEYEIFDSLMDYNNRRKIINEYRKIPVCTLFLLIKYKTF